MELRKECSNLNCFFDDKMTRQLRLFCEKCGQFDFSFKSLISCLVSLRKHQGDKFSTFHLVSLYVYPSPVTFLTWGRGAVGLRHKGVQWLGSPSASWSI